VKGKREQDVWSDTFSGPWGSGRPGTLRSVRGRVPAAQGEAPVVELDYDSVSHMASIRVIDLLYCCPEANCASGHTMATCSA